MLCTTYLEEAVLCHVQKRSRLLTLNLLSHGLGHQGPQLIDVDDRTMELVHGLVEVTHTDLSKVPWMVLVEEDAVVVHTSSVTTTSRMLPVLAHTSMSSTDVASFRAVLLQAGRHGSCLRVAAPACRATKRMRKRERECLEQEHSKREQALRSPNPKTTFIPGSHPSLNRVSALIYLRKAGYEFSQRPFFLLFSLFGAQSKVYGCYLVRFSCSPTSTH